MFTRCHFANIIRRIYDYYTCISSSSKITLSIPITSHYSHYLTPSMQQLLSAKIVTRQPGRQWSPTNQPCHTEFGDPRSCLELRELTNVGLVKFWDQVKWEKCGWFMNENQRWNTEWKTCVFCNVQWGDYFKTRNLVTCFFFNLLVEWTDQQRKSWDLLHLCCSIDSSMVCFHFKPGGAIRQDLRFHEISQICRDEMKAPRGLAGLDCCYQGPALVPLGVAERLTSWLTWYRCGRWKWM